MLYPLKFEKVLIEKVWGGNSFRDILNFPIDDKNYGESWEVSSHKNGMSIVQNGDLKGKTLQELLELYKEELVGEEVYKNYQNKFPLLIKFLDINDKLSVQVHPDDKYALINEGEFGKSECWYIIKASEDAKLIMGLAKDMTKDLFLEKVRNKDFEGLFNVVNVEDGDFIEISPGMVHASLEGSILICEPQQNSDSTYRIYDFDRIVDGEKRPLHLDKAAEVIDFNALPKISKKSFRKNMNIGKNIIEELVETEYFKCDLLTINESFNLVKGETFKVVSLLKGKGEIKYNETIYPLENGDTYLIPAKIDIVINGKLEAMVTYI